LHATPEGFDHGVGVRVTDGAKERQEPCLPYALSECPGGEWRAVIQVDHAPCVGLSGSDRHGKGIGGQVCTSSEINGPADYPSGERVQHDATERFPFPRGMFRSVGHPQVLRSRAGEVPLDQISNGDSRSGSLASAAIDRQAGQASAAYQQSHGVVSDPQPLPMHQFCVHALPAVRSVRFRVERGDHVRQPRVTGVSNSLCK